VQNITPCLWFDNHAEEAVTLYVSVFKRSGIGHVTRYGDAGSAISGRSFRKGENMGGEGGSRTGTASPGRSCLPC
jgi:hypothetical protein